jgi:hypothetical protein
MDEGTLTQSARESSSKSMGKIAVHELQNLQPYNGMCMVFDILALQERYNLLYQQQTKPNINPKGQN